MDASSKLGAKTTDGGTPTVELIDHLRCQGLMDLSEHMLDEAADRLELLERDAKRYQWLRANRLEDTDEACDVMNALVYSDWPSFDAAIDAVMMNTGTSVTSDKHKHVKFYLISTSI